MIEDKSPLRSEIADIQNSLVQGADGILLDRETSYGKHPVESVSMVSQTIAESGSIIDPYKKFKTLFSMCDFYDKDELLIMSVAKIILTREREPIDYILTLSKQGKMAKMLAKYYLPIDILACCPDSKIVKQLNLVTGLKAVKVPNYTSKLLGPDHLIQIIMRTNRSMGLGVPGHWVIVIRTKDAKEGAEETENYFKIERIPE